MNTFNENNKLTLNDVVEGLLDGREYKFNFECFLETYSEKISSFSQLAKFIHSFDYMNIKIEEV